MAFARMLLSMMTTKQKETFPSPEAAGRTKSPRALLAGILRDVLPQLRHTGSFLILLTAFLVLLSCGPAPSGTPSGATVYSGSTYSLLGPTALVSVGSVPWYANATGNTLVGLVPDTGFELSGYAPVTISNPLSTFTTTYDLSDPVAMAVDLSGNLWVASQKNNSIVSLDSCFTGSNPNYNSCSVTGYQKNLDIPSGVAADPSGNIWVANQGNNTLLVLSVTTCTYSCPSSDYSPSYDGTSYSPTLYCLSGSSCTPMGSGCVLSSPSAIASDSNGNIWVINSSPASLTEIVSGNASTCRTFTASELSLDNPVALATDTSGDLAIVNQGTKGSDSGSVVYLPSGCTPGSCSPVVLSGASLGVSQPVSATFAQNGDLWVAEAGNNSATDMPSGCLSGGACQPIVYAGSAYPFGTPTSILAIGSTIWVLGASALVSITPSGP